MAFAASTNATEPMSELNTTPLIDVMLVLLVMFIITIPVATHSLTVDLPQGHTTIQVNSLRNEISLTPSGNPTWNGTIITHERLASLLIETTRMEPEPATLFNPDPQASYQAAAQIIAMAQQAGITNFAFVGNEQHRSFGDGR